MVIKQTTYNWTVFKDHKERVRLNTVTKQLDHIRILYLPVETALQNKHVLLWNPGQTKKLQLQSNVIKCLLNSLILPNVSATN